jgi:hypothetical protein
MFAILDIGVVEPGVESLKVVVNAQQRLQIFPDGSDPHRSHRLDLSLLLPSDSPLLCRCR